MRRSILLWQKFLKIFKVLKRHKPVGLPKKDHAQCDRIVQASTCIEMHPLSNSFHIGIQIFTIVVCATTFVLSQDNSAVCCIVVIDFKLNRRLIWFSQWKVFFVYLQVYFLLDNGRKFPNTKVRKNLWISNEFRYILIYVFMIKLLQLHIDSRKRLYFLSFYIIFHFYLSYTSILWI